VLNKSLSLAGFDVSFYSQPPVSYWNRWWLALCCKPHHKICCTACIAIFVNF